MAISSAFMIKEILHKYWGYDYREDCKSVPTPDYFYNFQQSLKDKKEEYSLAVRLNGKMIGEIVLWNFGLDGSIETGFRFFKEYQGKGYGRLLLNYAIAYAREQQYNKICLDTRKQFSAAQHLYRSSGFQETEKYNDKKSNIESNAPIWSNHNARSHRYFVL